MDFIYASTTATLTAQSSIPPAQAETFAASIKNAYNSRFVEPTRVQWLTDQSLMVTLVTAGQTLAEEQAQAVDMIRRHAIHGAHLYGFDVIALVTKPFTPRWLQ
jgi:hypothetical protein